MTPSEQRPHVSRFTSFVAGLMLGLTFLALNWGGWTGALAMVAFGGVACAFFLWEDVLSWRGGGRRPRRTPSQVRIAQLEGDLGLPVLTAGECWHCHRPLATEAKFCNYCGKTAEKPTANVCAACQTRNPLDSMFCSECGNRLPAA
jgi:hypothetical protein